MSRATGPKVAKPLMSSNEPGDGAMGVGADDDEGARCVWNPAAGKTTRYHAPMGLGGGMLERGCVTHEVSGGPRSGVAMAWPEAGKG